jgi:hypothetical protein
MSKRKHNNVTDLKDPGTNKNPGGKESNIDQPSKEIKVDPKEIVQMQQMQLARQSNEHKLGITRRAFLKEERRIMSKLDVIGNNIFEYEQSLITKYHIIGKIVGADAEKGILKTG